MWPQMRPDKLLVNENESEVSIMTVLSAFFRIQQLSQGGGRGPDGRWMSFKRV